MSNPNEKFADQRFKYPSPGVSAVGQYQLSGIPFASASILVNEGGESPTEVNFPYVTKFITVQNLATGSNKPLRLGFSELGTTGSAVNDGFDNFFVLDNGESLSAEIRVSSIYLLGAERPLFAGHDCIRNQTTASVIAGMTGIPAAKLQTNWSGTSGVG
tara:strand:- start:107 stop:583 length:477 start_codon:yes stop_codon:yes gene_type:complete